MEHPPPRLAYTHRRDAELALGLSCKTALALHYLIQFTVMLQY